MGQVARYSGVFASLLCCLFWVTAGADEGASDKDTGRARDESRPRICLALGGGGVRGMAHVGVLQVLEQMRVPVDCVAGTSIGAVVGSFVSLGMSVEEIEGLALNTDWQAIFADSPPRSEMSMRRRQDELSMLVTVDIGVNSGGLVLPRGLIQGQNLLVYLRNLGKDYALEKNFDRLPVPYRAVATDLETGESLIIGSGDLPKAVRASMSVPAIFAPAQVDGRLLVDGGLFANVPVDAAKSMGADVIIAVDVGYPARTRSGLTSALEIADQTVTLMMRKGTESQLAKLGDGDILIVPALGETSSAAFDLIPELIEMGRAAAMGMADRLSRYSVSPAEYANLIKTRGSHHEIETPEIVREVSAKVDAKMSDEAMHAWVSQEEGAPLDIPRLERDLQRIYGLGVFEAVDYSLAPLDDGAWLRISATQKSWGPNFLRFGVRLEDVFDGESDFALGVRYTMTQLNSLAAEWRNDVQIGRDGGITTEFYQPLNYGSPYFVAVGALLTSRALKIYESLGSEAIGEVRFHNLGFKIDAGKEIFGLGELRLGMSRGRAQRRLSVGDVDDPRLADVDLDIGEMVLNFEHDSFDSVPFPRAGSLATFNVALSRQALGASSQFERYSLAYLSAWSRGPYTTMFGLDMQTYEGLSPEGQVEPFSLGGFLRLSGLGRNELTGNQLLLTKLILLRRLDAMSFGSIPVYLGGSVELGDTWQDRSLVQINNALWSGSAFLAADTLVGPIYLGAGYTEGGHGALYLAIGYVF
jgi:NTE family protein